jgi:hypothetical protein
LLPKKAICCELNKKVKDIIAVHEFYKRIVQEEIQLGIDSLVRSIDVVGGERQVTHEKVQINGHDCNGESSVSARYRPGTSLYSPTSSYNEHNYHGGKEDAQHKWHNCTTNETNPIDYSDCCKITAQRGFRGCVCQGVHRRRRVVKFKRPNHERQRAQIGQYYNSHHGYLENFAENEFKSFWKNNVHKAIHANGHHKPGGYGMGRNAHPIARQTEKLVYIGQIGVVYLHTDVPDEIKHHVNVEQAVGAKINGQCVLA